MKKSIKSIAAFAAALTMTFSCVPAAYAVDGEDVPAVQTETETETKTGLEFTVGKTIETPFKGTAEVCDENGTVYYSGYDRTNHRLMIYTLGENGNMKNSYSVDRYVNDKGETIGVADSTLKQCGDHLYVIYSEACGFSIRENVIIKLDRELNEVAKYKYKKSHSIDTNGEKVVYLKGNSKICICDMDGKNLKTIYTTNKSGEKFEQPLNYVAIAGNYIGFAKGESYPGAPDYKEYCGLIDINTGEVAMLKEQRSVNKVFSRNGNIIWRGDDGYCIDDGAEVPMGAEAMEEYNKNHYKKYDTTELYIFDGKDFSVFSKPQEDDTYFPMGIAFDNEGNIITEDYKTNGSKLFRFYRDGRLLGEYTVNYKGYCGFTANNGVLTICYTGRDSTESEWFAFDPENVDLEELRSGADTSPSAKDTIKSVTIYYK